MTIKFGSVVGPSEIKLVTSSGTKSLDRVYYNIGGVAWEVWRKAPLLPSVITITQSDGNVLYFRNMKYHSGVLGSKRLIYRGEVTITTKFTKYKNIGVSSYTDDVISWSADVSSSSTITSIVGIPSGYTFTKGGSLDLAEQTLAMGVDKTPSTVFDPSRLTSMNLRSWCEVNSDGTMFIKTYMPGNNWPVYTISTGKTWQCAGEFSITPI